MSAEDTRGVQMPRAEDVAVFTSAADPSAMLNLSRRQVQMMDRHARMQARGALVQIELNLQKVQRDAQRGVAAVRRLLAIINYIERRAAHENPVRE